MVKIVETPTVIQDAMPFFEDLFHNVPQREHLAEYLTGLIVAKRKTILGMCQEFAATTDQSCWNRFLREAEWDADALNERRLEMLQQDATTCYHKHGVIAIDDVLIDHDGKLIADVGWFWDHAEDRHKIAHDYLFVNYVCGSGKHYPLEFRRFKKRELCEATNQKFLDHGVLFRQLISLVIEHDIPGEFTFDSYFSGAENLNFINDQHDEHGGPRIYVGDLKTNRKLWYRGKEWNVEAFAASIKPCDRKEIRRGDKRQWYYTCTVRMPKVNHKVRIILIWNNRRDRTLRKVLVTNRLTWEVKRILKVYRHRWTGTETFHRDGKQELGMGDCQLRDNQGQTRHMYLVMLAYSLLMIQLKHGRAKEWALRRLTTIGDACRAVTNETLKNTIEWAIRQVTENPTKMQHITALLGLT